MTNTATDIDHPTRERRITSIEVLCVVLVLAIIGQGWLQGLLDQPPLRTGATVFVAIFARVPRKIKGEFDTEYAPNGPFGPIGPCAIRTFPQSPG